MKIGFNLEALANDNFKFVKDKNGYEKKLKSVVISDQAKQALTALNDANHEIFIFSPTPVEIKLEKKVRIKKQIIKKLNEQGINFSNLAIVDENEMSDAFRRNHIDIVVDNNKETLGKSATFTDTVDSSYNDMLNDIFENIEKNRQTIMAMDKEANGLPSEDQLWLKDYRVGDYKWNDEQMSPYDRLISSNVDWLDEQAMEFNPVSTMLPDSLPDSARNLFTKKFTYKQFFDEVDKLAEKMEEAGIKKGTRVPVVLVNTPESFMTIYALYKIKATVAPIFPLEKPEKFKEKLDRINKENAENGINNNFLFASDLVLGKLQEVIPDNENVISLPITNSMAAPLKTAFEKVVMPKLGVKPVKYDNKVIKYNDFLGVKRNKLSKDEKEYKEYVDNIEQGYDNSYTAVQLYTGGTIKAKGVKLSEESIDSATKQFYNDRFDFRRGDKIAAFMPLNHSFGLIIGTHVASSLGVNLDVIMKIDFEKIYKYFLKDKVNIFGGIPNMFTSITQSKEFEGKDLSNVKYLLSGGAKIDKQTQADAKEFFESHNSTAEVHDGYGQTESAGGIIYDGIPNMNTNVKIVKPGTTEELGYEEIGELCITGPQIMQGYDDEELTANALREHEDGKIWLHTGDLATIHKDGRVQYLDRGDRMIKVNGEQVYLNQIEEEINTLPFVERCAAVKRSDDIRGNVPVVFIKLKPDTVWSEEIDSKINDFYKEKFNSSSKPRATEFVDELPVTGVGKIDIKVLEALAEEKYAEQKAR